MREVAISRQGSGKDIAHKPDPLVSKEIEPRHPEQVIIVTDIGRDPDDMLSLVLARYLQDAKQIDLKGVIATHLPPHKRAALARYTLDEIGLAQVPVAVGTKDTKLKIEDIHEYEFRDLPSLYGGADLETHSENDLPQSNTLFEQLLNGAEDNSINLLIIASLHDVYRYIHSSPEAETLFKRKVKEVTIMGGVKTKEGNPDEFDLDPVTGFLQPDISTNYIFDPERNKKTLDFFQESNIPMSFVSRYAAYAAKLPHEIYDGFGQTGHPIGKWLASIKKETSQSFWNLVNEPDNPDRKLPPRQNREWYINTFCDGVDTGVNADGDIWPYVKTINLYDPLAMLSLSPQYREKFFTPTKIMVNGTIHKIYGISENNQGVNDPDELRTFITGALTQALEVSKK